MERDAVALHRSGRPIRSFWLKHWSALGKVAREGPEVYQTTIQRLHHLLASGDVPQAQAVVPVVQPTDADTITPPAQCL